MQKQQTWKLWLTAMFFSQNININTSVTSAAHIIRENFTILEWIKVLQRVGQIYPN